MDIMKSLQEEYHWLVQINKKEYEDAKLKLSPEEFEDNYWRRDWRYYRYVLANDNQLIYVMLHDLSQVVQSINKKMRLFYILTILGLIAGTIWLLIYFFTRK